MTIAPPGAWTEERVRRLLEEEELGYQRIELPYGLATGGNDRSSTASVILPRDLRGKTVLDVGSSLGYFCFEALRRGAARAVGVDVDPESVRKARILAEVLGLPAEFRVLDVDDEPIDDRFDHVLCLNVLHHTRNPFVVLDRLIAATSERLVLEVAAIGRHDRRKLELSWLAGRLLRSTPAVFVGRQGASTAAGEQRFFLTQRGLENFLRYQRRTFGEVRSVRSPFKDRFISIAERRRIEHLVVVAGPTSVGKTTLIDRLVAGREPRLAAALGIEDPTGWAQTGPTALHRLHGSAFEGLFFHYDFLRPYFRSAKTHDRDETLEVLDGAARITFATLIAPLDALGRRLEEHEIRPKTRAGVYRGSTRTLKIRRAYGDPARMRDMYEGWLGFARSRTGRHVIVSTAGAEPAVHPIDGWDRVALAHGLAARGADGVVGSADA